MSKLTKKQSEILRKVVVGGMTVPQVAADLGCSIGNVASQLSSAKKNARKIYEGAGGPSQKHRVVSDVELRKVLPTLSEPHQRIVRLVRFERMKLGEVAKVLQIPKGTARKRLYAAYEQARIFLGPS